MKYKNHETGTIVPENQAVKEAMEIIYNTNEWDSVEQLLEECYTIVDED